MITGLRMYLATVTVFSIEFQHMPMAIHPTLMNIVGKFVPQFSMTGSSGSTKLAFFMAHK